MTSRYPNPDNSADHSFDSDIHHLLEDLDQEMELDQEGASFESDGDIDELVGLFDEDLSDSLDQETAINPSDDEISELFNNDFAWEEESENWQNTSEVEYNNVSQKLDDNQNINDADTLSFDYMEIESTFGDFEENKDLEDLKELLGGQDSDTAPKMPTGFSSLALIRDYYPLLEELELLLEQPATDTAQEGLDEATAAELAALIDSPPSITETLSPSTTVAHLEMSDLDNDDDLVDSDDEFKDLEAMLEQGEKGSSSSIIPTRGQRFPTRSRTTKTNVFEQTMRVPVKQLDNLSNLIGELVVKRNRLEEDQERLRQFLDNLLNQVQNLGDVGGRMQDLYERTLLEGALLASRNSNNGFSGYVSDNESKSKTTTQIDPENDQGLDALEMDRFTGFHLLSQEMIELIVRVRESASDIQFLVDETEQVSRSLRQATTQLQEEITTSRMVPFAQTADRLPRAVRDISMKLNKQAKLLVEGRDVLIDKVILQQLYDPMTHLVNNAIAHGIEDPETRQKRSKSPEGHVYLRAFLQGNQTVLTVSDDGGGIDSERVKAKAIEKHLITREEATTLSEAEIYDFIFHPGFSTRDKADDFAGRGVGLDVVRTCLSEIRGSVTIDSVAGEGTTFTIRLPLTLSICKALCCVSDRARMAFPMDGVEDMKDYLPGDLITDEQGQQSVYWNNQQLPVYLLGDLLSYNRQLGRGNVYGGKHQEDTVSLVILQGAGNLLAVQVDQVIGEQEIVIKQIEGPIPKPAGIAGATVLGDGTIMPIGDVLELIEIGQGRLRTDGNSSLWKKNDATSQTLVRDHDESTVLIVDDSITVRELLSLSFSKSGYRVEQARDGQEAWEKLRAGLPCDLVFCDIEMPRMNGLELLSNLQKDSALSHLPVALLTSRGADRHRKVAAQLGATAYFIKPCPDQTLLNAAERMLDGEILLPGSTKKPFVKPSSTSSNDLSSSPSSTLPIESNVVLIIDDSVMVREMLSMSFSKGGYEVEQARDGQEAWEKLREGLSCGLILCDIEMPRMTGLELLSRLQEDQKLSRIPMAMITSRGAKKMQRIAAERGAKGYFVKPYIEEVLLDAAKRLMAGEVLLNIDGLIER